MIIIIVLLTAWSPSIHIPPLHIGNYFDHYTFLTELNHPLQPSATFYTGSKPYFHLFLGTENLFPRVTP